MKHYITRPNSKYWDKAAYWYKDTGKLYKLCLGCGNKDKYPWTTIKSSGFCTGCQDKLKEMGYFSECGEEEECSIFDKFIVKNPFFSKFKH